MTEITEYFRWWVVDGLHGARRLTPYKLSRANAQKAFPGAKPDLPSREIRSCSDPETPFAESRAGDVDAAPAPRRDGTGQEP